MAGTRIRITGIDRLEKELRERNIDLDRAVRWIVRKQERPMLEGISNRARRGSEGGVFTGGYSGNEQSLGGIKNNTRGSYRDKGWTLNIGTSSEYGAYVEYGTRHMPAEPVFGPTVQEVFPEFKAMLERIMR